MDAEARIAQLEEALRITGEVADYVAATLPNNPDTSTVLRKLLEAKDAAVWAGLD